MGARAKRPWFCRQKEEIGQSFSRASSRRKRRKFFQGSMRGRLAWYVVQPGLPAPLCRTRAHPPNTSTTAAAPESVYADLRSIRRCFRPARSSGPDSAGLFAMLIRRSWYAQTPTFPVQRMSSSALVEGKRRSVCRKRAAADQAKLRPLAG